MSSYPTLDRTWKEVWGQLKADGLCEVINGNHVPMPFGRLIAARLTSLIACKGWSPVMVSRLCYLLEALHLQEKHINTMVANEVVGPADPTAGI